MSHLYLAESPHWICPPWWGLPSGLHSTSCWYCRPASLSSGPRSWRWCPGWRSSDSRPRSSYRELLDPRWHIVPPRPCPWWCRWASRCSELAPRGRPPPLAGTGLSWSGWGRGRAGSCRTSLACRWPRPPYPAGLSASSRSLAATRSTVWSSRSCPPQPGISGGRTCPSPRDTNFSALWSLTCYIYLTLLHQDKKICFKKLVQLDITELKVMMLLLLVMTPLMSEPCYFLTSNSFSPS